MATSDISLITRVSSSASVFDRSLCRIIIDRSSLFIFPFRKFEKSRFYYIRLSSSHPDSAVFSSFTRDFGRLLFFSRKVLCIFFFFCFLQRASDFFPSQPYRISMEYQYGYCGLDKPVFRNIGEEKKGIEPVKIKKLHSFLYRFFSFFLSTGLPSPLSVRNSFSQSYHIRLILKF